MKKRLFFLLPLLLISFQAVWSQSSTDQLDHYVIKKMNRAQVVGMQLGYLKQDGTVWSGSYGLKNMEAKRGVNDSTLFMIASCSKPITALAILKLYHDKKLDLDTDINQYLPFFLANPYYPDEGITIRMLLTHTSSLKDNWEVLDPMYTLEEGGDSPIRLKDFIPAYFLSEGKYFEKGKNFFNEEPGTYWEYANMGYALLGLIIEAVSEKSFSQYMQEDIFYPLGMFDSYWFLKDIPHDNVARPHTLPEDKKDSIQVLKHYGYPDFPDGQLRTTTTDYLKFVKLIINEGRIEGETFIAKEIVDQFHTVQYPEVNRHQAVAWNYNEFDNFLYYLLMPRLPAHTGGDPGVATVVAYDPEDKIAAVVFMNSPPTTFRGGKILYLDLPKRLLKEARE